MTAKQIKFLMRRMQEVGLQGYCNAMCTTKADETAVLEWNLIKDDPTKFIIHASEDKLNALISYFKVNEQIRLQ